MTLLLLTSADTGGNDRAHPSVRWPQHAQTTLCWHPHCWVWQSPDLVAWQLTGYLAGGQGNTACPARERHTAGKLPGRRQRSSERHFPVLSQKPDAELQKPRCEAE